MRNQLFSFFIFIFCLITAQSSVYANTIVSCGEAHGKAYYFPNAIEPSGGWKNDGYSGGVNNLIELADGKFDIEFGGGKSILNSGGNVIPLGTAKTMFLTSVMSSVELYIFDTEKKKLAILQYRTGLVDKAATYIADCR